MADDRSRIPVFESEFLQEMAIDLKQRLDAASLSAESGKLEFRVADHENDSGEWECFDAVRTLRQQEYIQVVICADGGANYVYRYPFLHNQDDSRYEAFIIDVGDWTPHEVAALVHDSLRQLPDVREIWRKLDVRRRY